MCDEYNRPGLYIILGSASRDLLKQSSESLAGRISYKKLTPFLWNEISKEDYEPTIEIIRTARIFPNMFPEKRKTTLMVLTPFGKVGSVDYKLQPLVMGRDAQTASNLIDTYLERAHSK